MKKSRFITVFVILLLLQVSRSSAKAFLEATPLLTCRLENNQVRAGEKTVLFVDVQEILDLYGYQFELYFAKDKVSLLDGDSERSGINFKLGDFLSPDFVVINKGNVNTGRADLALTQMDPSKPRTGSGVLARIEVQALEPGEALFTFNNVILATSSAEKIAHSLRGCSLQVLPAEQPTQLTSPTPTPNTIQVIIDAQATSALTDIQPTSTPATGQEVDQQPIPTYTLPAVTVIGKVPNESVAQMETEPPLEDNFSLDSEVEVKTPASGSLVPLGFGLGALFLGSIVYLLRKLR